MKNNNYHYINDRPDLQLYLFIMLVKKLILSKMIVGVFFQPGFLSEFLFPFCHLGIPEPALGEVSV